MAVLYISEFQRISNHNTYGPQIVPVDVQGKQVSQAVAFGSTTTNPLQPNTNIVRLLADAACTFALGTSNSVTPSTTTDIRLAAGVPEYWAVPHTQSAPSPAPSIQYWIGATAGS